MRKLAEETHKPKVEKNNFKCPKCHRVGGLHDYVMLGWLN